jgi:hypothetical protein
MNPNPQRNRKRWLLRLAILPLIAIVGLLYANKEQAQDPLIVLNRSGQPIARLKVTVGEKTVTFSDLPAGAQKTTSLTIDSDDPFRVEGELANGSMIRIRGKAVERTTQLIVLPGGEIKLQQAGKQ